ncbi:ubiquitin-like protein, partial [Cenococcum geophilum]
FQITLRDLTGRAFILNEITSSLKVSKLKEKFEAKEGIPTYDQKLIFEGKELID